jgi:hypothetical protein
MREPIVFGLLWFSYLTILMGIAIFNSERKWAWRICLMVGAVALVFMANASFGFAMGCRNGMSWSDFFLLKDLPTSGSCMNRLGSSYGMAAAFVVLAVWVAVLKK